jgi:hypothetical protein
MTGRMRAALLAAVVLGVSVPAIAAPVETAVCRRDRLVADGLLVRTRDRLLNAERATLAVQCAAWRDHVFAARQVAAIHGRCTTGPERDAILREMKESEAGFTARIAQQCKATPAP